MRSGTGHGSRHFVLRGASGLAAQAICRDQQANTDAYIKSVASSADPAATIAKGHELLEKGAITQAEFEQLKAGALAGG